MEDKIKYTKRPKRLVINCCGHNMCVIGGYYNNGFAIRHRFCMNCHSDAFTVQYPNADEKLIDEYTFKTLKEAYYEH